MESIDTYKAFAFYYCKWLVQVAFVSGTWGLLRGRGAAKPEEPRASSPRRRAGGLPACQDSELALRPRGGREGADPAPEARLGSPRAAPVGSGRASSAGPAHPASRKSRPGRGAGGFRFRSSWRRRPRRRGRAAWGWRRRWAPSTRRWGPAAAPCGSRRRAPATCAPATSWRRGARSGLASGTSRWAGPVGGAAGGGGPTSDP